MRMKLLDWNMFWLKLYLSNFQPPENVGRSGNKKKIQVGETSNCILECFNPHPADPSQSLPLSPSSTTSRESLSQFSTCSGWRWLEVGEKFKKIAIHW